MLHRIISVLPCLVCLFWAAFLYICRSNCNRARSSLTTFMLVAAVLYLCHALFFLGSYSALFDTLYTGANLAVYPLYLLYIRRLTSFEGAKRRDNVILVVPVAAVVLTATLYFLMPKTDVAAFVDGFLYGRPVDFASRAAAVQIVWHRIVPLIFAAEVVYAAIVGIRSISAYNAELKRFYSSDNGRSLKSVRNLLLAFIATSACSMTVNIIGKLFFAENDILLAIPSFLFGTMLFLLGFVGVRQKFSAEEFAAEMLVDRKQPYAISDALRAELIQNIIGIFENEQVYLNYDYKITDLATRLGTNRTYVSTVINNYFDCNFSDFVNRYRIEQAKSLLRAAHTEGKMPKMCIIFEESGFQSESSFYRIFKEQAGITPRQFIDNL